VKHKKLIPYKFFTLFLFCGYLKTATTKIEKCANMALKTAR